MKTKQIAVIVFFLVLGWVLFLTHGLTIGDFDDWDHILAAEDLSWGTLADNFFTPWSQSHYWDGQSDRINEVTHRRIFLSVILKVIHSFSAYQFWSYFVFSKAFFFAGSAAIVFWILTLLTSSWLLRVLGSLFYILIPAHYPHILWITDPITMVHFFVLSGALAFSRIYETFSIESKKLDREWLWWLVFFMAGWFAIKTKEPGLILPLTIGAFLLVNYRTSLSFPKKSLGLFALCAILAFQIVPVLHLNDTAPVSHGFHWETISRLWLRNFECGYENEPGNAFFSWEHIWPASIARTFGFFLLWTLVLFGILYFVQRFKRNKATPSCLSRFWVCYALCWLVIEVYFMGRFQPDPRYFSGTMIPLTILAVRLLDIVLHGLQKPQQIFGRYFLLGVLVWTVIQNFNHVVWLRTEIGKRNNQLFGAASAIYHDLFPDKPATRRDIGLFYASRYDPDPNHPRMKNYTAWTLFGYQDWNVEERLSPEKFAQTTVNERRYFVSDRNDIFSGSHQVQLVARVPSLTYQGVFDQVYYRFKKKKPQPIYVYKRLAASMGR